MTALDAFWRGLFGSEYWLARFAFQRGLAFIYLMAFLVAFNQFRPLLGENGLLPVPQFLTFVNFRRAPSIFHFFYSDKFVDGISLTGILLSIVALTSLSERGPFWISIVVWSLLYVLYLSIMNVGQTFYGFGWESMLLETGFLAILLGSSRMAVPVPIIFLLRWMLFRVEFGAGLIKLRGDPCWSNLTCLNYHHETQPLPNPLSSYFHHLPNSFHKLEVLGNFAAQLVVPWGLFFPQPVAAIAGALIVLTQMWLFISGNYSWLNALTMLLAVSSFSNERLHAVVRAQIPGAFSSTAAYQWLIVVFTAVVIVLSYWPVHNMLSRRQLMNTSFNPYHLVNTYGAFGSVTKVRYEIVIEGTGEDAVREHTAWKEYEFKAKPGNPMRRPSQVAPYHLRLDWLMWFAAMSPAYDYMEHPWFIILIQKLLENDPATLRLLARNPFPQGPGIIRARLYRYRFATAKERRETGQWWVRLLAGEYLPPVSIRAHDSRVDDGADGAGLD
jgi:Lipase maturation factor